MAETFTTTGLLADSTDTDSSTDSEDDDKTPLEHDVSYDKVRIEMKELPLGELIKIQDKVGLQQFSKIYCRKNHDTIGDADSIHATLFKEPKNRKKSSPKIKNKLETKRQDKDAPVEVSNKKQTSRFRNVINVHKQKYRDPRFDPTSAGDYNNEIFMKNYKFIGDLRDQEKQELSKKVQLESDTTERKKLKAELRKIKKDNTKIQKTFLKRSRLKQMKAEEKAKVKDGKKPFFMKKSAIRQLELEKQYEDLKQRGQLDSFLQSKRKKNAQRQRKKMPIT